MKKNRLQENFTMADIKEIEGIKDFSLAISRANEILEKASKNTDPRRISFLFSQIDSANSMKSLLRILINMFLAGEKLAVVDSKYMK